MSDAPTPIPAAQARTNITILVLAQAILGAQMPVHFIIGGLSGQMLVIDKCWATLPISMTVLGSMITAPFMSNLMYRLGRRPGFVLGVAGSTLGAALCAYALWVGSFMLFLAGSFLIGVYMSAQGFYRFAAADTVDAAARPKAISYVMAGGLASAVLGPQLVKLTGDVSAVPFIGGYLSIIAVNLVGVFLFIRLQIPKPAAPAADAPAGRSRWELIRSPGIATAMICAMVSYSLMNLVMTSTPLAVVGCGYTTEHSADVVMAHVLGMFAPAFFTGHLITRFGHATVIGAGLAILAAAGAVALAGVTLMHFYVALILLGVGWNFGFIGATALLTTLQRPGEQGRVQGMNDFLVFGMVTLASVSSGGLMNCSATTPQDGWAAVNLAMLPFLLVAAVALAHLVVSRRRAAMG